MYNTPFLSNRMYNLEYAILRQYIVEKHDLYKLCDRFSTLTPWSLEKLRSSISRDPR